MTPQQWEQVRASEIWQAVVLPVLLTRQSEIDRALRKAADERTMLLLQGGAAEIEHLLGDPQKDARDKARRAEIAKNAPEETDPNGRRAAPRGNDRVRRLAERRNAG